MRSGKTPPSTTARPREGSLRYRASRALETHALRRAGHITTICEGLRREIVERGIPRRARDGDSECRRRPRVSLRRCAGSGACGERSGSTGATVIGFAGSFYAYEGLDLLLEAAALLAAAACRTCASCWWAAVRRKRRSRRRQRALSLGDRVVFTGRVPHADVQRYYDLIDVLAYPRQRHAVDRDRHAAEAAGSDGAGAGCSSPPTSAGIASSSATARRAFSSRRTMPTRSRDTIERVLARRDDWPRDARRGSPLRRERSAPGPGASRATRTSTRSCWRAACAIAGCTCRA